LNFFADQPVSCPEGFKKGGRKMLFEFFLQYDETVLKFTDSIVVKPAVFVSEDTGAYFGDGLVGCMVEGGNNLFFLVF